MNRESPEVKAAQEEIDQLLRRLGEIIGPDKDPDNYEDDEYMPEGNPLLGEWVLVSAWTDDATGKGFITKVSSTGTVEHHIHGLLWDGLHNF